MTERKSNLQMHEQHLAHQMQGNTGELHKDYADHAVVEESMYSEHFVDKADQGHNKIKNSGKDAPK